MRPDCAARQRSSQAAAAESGGRLRWRCCEGVDIAIASNQPDDKCGNRRRNPDAGRAGGWHTADVSVEAQVVEMVAQAVASLGHLDLFVKQCGGTWHQPVTRITSEAWLQNDQHQPRGVSVGCREVLQALIAAPKVGVFLIVGSTAQIPRLTVRRRIHISKSGLRIFKNTLALEMAPYGIRVNMLVPGHFPTRLTVGMPEAKVEIHERPGSRCGGLGKTDELGPAAVLLAVRHAESVSTGAELTVRRRFLAPAPWAKPLLVGR